MSSLRVGVDVGGTFTDLVLEDGASQRARLKVQSTPAAPTDAVIRGLQTMIGDSEGVEIGDLDSLVHGTTVATNAVIQARWARTGLITSEGFRDVIEIRRQQRPHVYDLRVPKPPPIAPRDMRLEVPERVRADGSVRTPLDEDALRAAVHRLRAARAQAIAVCFLHSYANPVHEQRAVEIIHEEAPELYVAASHRVAAEFREYPRVSTTIINASLGPVMGEYLAALTRKTQSLGLALEPRIMQSNGGLASASATAQLPAQTLVSGPSAGVIGAVDAARRSGVADLVTLDVGGTSSDVCLVEHGEPVTTVEKSIAGYPLRGIMVDVHSIGAGGGSIAWKDEGGFLQVGPQSAGAVPGPACYGGGGDRPTVTDAQLVLGRLGDRLLGGRMKLDSEAAKDAIREHVAEPFDMDVVEAAEAMLRVANASIARAIRRVSVERGHDPRKFTLVAYGGAGPLHVAEVGRDVGFDVALIPGIPGLLSAYGLLASPIRRDFSRTHPFSVSDADREEIRAVLGEIDGEARRWLDAEAPKQTHRIIWAFDLRYVGQSFEITVPLPNCRLSDAFESDLTERFYREYARLYGDAPEAPIEAVTVRVSATTTAAETRERPTHRTLSSQSRDVGSRSVFFGASGFVSTPVHSRAYLEDEGSLDGPVIVEQDDSTLVIPPDTAIEWDPSGNIIVRLNGPKELHRVSL